jgi:hypothetical protein
MGEAGKTEAEKARGREKIMDNLKRAAIYVRVSTAEQPTCRNTNCRSTANGAVGVVLFTGTKARVVRRMTGRP